MLEKTILDENRDDELSLERAKNVHEDLSVLRQAVARHVLGDPYGIRGRARKL